MFGNSSQSLSTTTIHSPRALATPVWRAGLMPRFVSWYHDAEPRVAEALELGDGVVGRGVVDDHDLEVGKGLIEAAVDAPADDRGAVVGRDDDAEERSWHLVRRRDGVGPDRRHGANIAGTAAAPAAQLGGGIGLVARFAKSFAV